MSRRWAGLTHSCEGQKVQVPQQQTCLSCLAKAPPESIPALAAAPRPLPRAHLRIRGARNKERARMLPVVQASASHCARELANQALPPFNIPPASLQDKLLGVICRYHCMLQQSAFLQFRHIPPRTISLLCLR